MGKHSFSKGWTLCFAFFWETRSWYEASLDWLQMCHLPVSTCQVLGFQVCMITICDLESFMLPVALSPGSFHKACFLFNLVLYFSMGGGGRGMTGIEVRDHFSPSTIWVLGIKLWWSSFTASTFIGSAILLVLFGFWSNVSYTSNRSQTWYVPKNDFEFMIFISSPSKFLDYKYVPPCLIYMVLGIKSRLSEC